MLIIKAKSKGHYIRLIKARYSNCFFVNSFAPNGALVSERFSTFAQAYAYYLQLTKSKKNQQVQNVIN